MQNRFFFVFRSDVPNHETYINVLVQTCMMGHVCLRVLTHSYTQAYAKHKSRELRYQLTQLDIQNTSKIFTFIQQCNWPAAAQATARTGA